MINVSSRIAGGPLGVMAHTQGRNALSVPGELRRAHTTLRHALLERELALHPRKAWVPRLLKGMCFGVWLGYMGPQQHVQSCNLRQHSITRPQTAQRVCRRPPPPNPTIPSVHCSGLGAVPKKGGKWRTIQHLSVSRQSLEETRYASSVIPACTPPGQWPQGVHSKTMATEHAQQKDNSFSWNTWPT